MQIRELFIGGDEHRSASDVQYIIAKKPKIKRRYPEISKIS